MRTPKNLQGMKFSRLTVIRKSPKKSHEGIFWICQCDCGTICESPSHKLTSGTKKSCGCLSEDNKMRFAKSNEENPNYSHGGSRTRLYCIWSNMKQRCSNPNTKSFRFYGGRGIRVCAEWESNFDTFREWAMANGYKENLTIDRINNDEGYHPDNCRWISREENTRERNNRKKALSQAKKTAL